MLPSSPARIREGQGSETAEPVNVTKARRGNGSTAPLILNLPLDPRGRSTLRRVCSIPGNQPRYPL